MYADQVAFAWTPSLAQAKEAAGIISQPKAEVPVGECQVAEASGSTVPTVPTGEYQVVEASRSTTPGTSQAAVTEQPPTSSQSRAAAVEASAHEEVQHAIELALEAGEQQWREKKDILSRENAFKLIRSATASSSSGTRDAFEAALGQIGQDTDESGGSGLKRDDEDTLQRPVPGTEERPLAALGPQVAVLARKEQCKKFGAETETGKVSMYSTAFFGKDELTESQVAALREPNPEIKQDFEEFRRLTAPASDEFKVMIDPNNLMPDELATLYEHGGLESTLPFSSLFGFSFKTTPKMASER